MQLVQHVWEKHPQMSGLMNKDTFWYSVYATMVVAPVNASREVRKRKHDVTNMKRRILTNNDKTSGHHEFHKKLS